VVKKIDTQQKGISNVKKSRKATERGLPDESMWNERELDKCKKEQKKSNFKRPCKIVIIFCERLVTTNVIIMIGTLYAKFEFNLNFFFFWTANILYNNNQVSVQDEQRPVNEELQEKGAVYKRHTNENTKTVTT
jgi:hypothetical protein